MALPPYFSHPACLEHETGAGHPERPARITAIERSLAERDWLGATPRRGGVTAPFVGASSCTITWIAGERCILISAIAPASHSRRRSHELARREASACTVGPSDGFWPALPLAARHAPSA